MPKAVALAMIARAKSPITGHRAATATLEKGSFASPPRAMHRPPTSAERKTVRTGPNQLGRMRAPKARNPEPTSQGRSVTSGSTTPAARSRFRHSGRSTRTAAATHAADQRRLVTVTRRKKAK